MIRLRRPSRHSLFVVNAVVAMTLAGTLVAAPGAVAAPAPSRAGTLSLQSDAKSASPHGLSPKPLAADTSVITYMLGPCLATDWNTFLYASTGGCSDWILGGPTTGFKWFSTLWPIEDPRCASHFNFVNIYFTPCDGADTWVFWPKDASKPNVGYIYDQTLSQAGGKPYLCSDYSLAVYFCSFHAEALWTIG
jgi:hypothetical protein